MIKYYHGGCPNIKRVLPPNKTKEPTTASFGAEGVCRRDKVYVTSDINEAMLFASCHYSGKGHVYEVLPQGEIQNDPDYFGEAECLECDSAKVIKRVNVKGKVLKKIRKELLNGL